MSAQLSELFRLIENLIRIGTVFAVDGQKVRVRCGKNESDWMQWITLRAGTTRTWNPPVNGEQVVVLSPGGITTAAVALCGLFSDKYTPPTLDHDKDTCVYPDGASITYDHATHVLTATLPEGSSAVITANKITANADSVTSNAPLTTCTGDTHVKGNLIVDKTLTYKGGMQGSTDQGGAAVTIKGNIAFEQGSLTHNGANIGSTHIHSGVHGDTGGPR